MKLILTAALAASLLSATAAVAQPGNANPDRGARGQQVDRKDQNAGDAARSRSVPPGRAAGAPLAQNAPGQQAAPGRAVIATPQAARSQNPPAARNTRSTPDRMVPTPRAARETPPPVSDVQAGRMSPPSPQMQNGNPVTTNNQGNRPQNARWSRGDRLPDQYRQNQYYVNDWQQHGLKQPPGGYRWVRDDNNDFFLALIATGVISDVIYRSDRDNLWRQHYSRTYSYNDDVYYQQCRSAPDPAGVLIGGLIGGLLGNAAGGGNRTGATIAGVIFGGAVGAALTSNMDCGDRSYAYKTYYNGFNSGRTGRYEWRNPSNNHRGEFRINSYYNDPYGFRCARFDQVTYIQGRSYNATGVACRQPDGSWTVIN